MAHGSRSSRHGPRFSTGDAGRGLLSRSRQHTAAYRSTPSRFAHAGLRFEDAFRLAG